MSETLNRVCSLFVATANSDPEAKNHVHLLSKDSGCCVGFFFPARPYKDHGCTV